MIYMEPNAIGWKPNFISWLAKLPVQLSDDGQKLLEVLFDWIVQPSIDFVKASCKEYTATSSVDLARGAMNLIECLLLDVASVIVPDERGPDMYTSWLSSYFLFSVIWAIGGNLTFESRPKFDTFLRRLASGQDTSAPQPKSIKIEVPLPSGGLVYDYQFVREV